MPPVAAKLLFAKGLFAAIDVGWLVLCYGLLLAGANEKGDCVEGCGYTGGLKDEKVWGGATLWSYAPGTAVLGAAANGDFAAIAIPLFSALLGYERKGLEEVLAVVLRNGLAFGASWVFS